MPKGPECHLRCRCLPVCLWMISLQTSPTWSSSRNSACLWTRQICGERWPDWIYMGKIYIWIVRRSRPQLQSQQINKSTNLTDSRYVYLESGGFLCSVKTLDLNLPVGTKKIDSESLQLKILHIMTHSISHHMAWMAEANMTEVLGYIAACKYVHPPGGWDTCHENKRMPCFCLDGMWGTPLCMFSLDGLGKTVHQFYFLQTGKMRICSPGVVPLYCSHNCVHQQFPRNWSYKSLDCVEWLWQLNGGCFLILYTI